MIKELKSVMQPDDILSFAAGDFFLSRVIYRLESCYAHDRSRQHYDLWLIQWIQQTNRAYTPSTLTKIKTALVDHAVNYLINQGVSSNQIIIGAAFYGRIWNEVLDVNNGLYQTGVFFKSWVIKIENNSTQVMPTIEIIFLKLPMLSIRRKDVFNFLRHSFGGAKNIIRKK